MNTILYMERDKLVTVLHNVRYFIKSANNVLGIMLVLIIVISIIFANQIAPYDPYQTNMSNALCPPSTKHLMGTDELGRDIFSRVVYGGRYSIAGPIMVVLLASAIGSTFGLISSLSISSVDEIMMRIADIFLSFPMLILAMLLAVVLGSGLWSAVIALSTAWWPYYARIARSKGLEIKSSAYIEAARAVGCSSIRILFQHVLRNSLSPLLVQMSLDLGNAVLITAGLSFLGLGVQPPTPEWGSMINIGRRYLLQAWWYTTFPGMAIFVTVLGVNMLGDGVRDLLDPRHRHIRK